MAIVTKENADKIRAEVISSALDVEDAITLALGHCYCPNEGENEAIIDRLIEDVLADLSFEKKIKLYKRFIDRLPDLPSGIIPQLNDIREKRNH